MKLLTPLYSKQQKILHTNQHKNQRTEQNKNQHSFHLSVYDIALIGMMAAILEVSKVAFAFLPNIELVSLFIIVFSLCFGKKAIFAVFIFVFIEGFLYGFGSWWISYLYIWPLLSCITLLFKKETSVVLFAIISGTFGLFFGALCSIPYLIIGGFSMGFAYWVAGIFFDIVHCIGNIVVCLILFIPLRYILLKAKNMIHT